MEKRRVELHLVTDSVGLGLAGCVEFSHSATRLWWTQRVVPRKGELCFEHTAFERGVGRSRDESAPLEEIRLRNRACECRGSALVRKEDG
jgi:hypothetical protein